MNWNKLRDEVHQNAVDKGFWNDTENGFSLAEKLALIHSEVSEALEADRKWRHCDLEVFDDALISLGFNSAFENCIKDTFEDELADVIIRCLDLCGKIKIDIDLFTKDSSDLILVGGKSIPVNLCELHWYISEYYSCAFEGYLVEVILYTMEIAKELDIDLLKHVELKMKYNSTREYKHGKKY